MSGRKPVVDLRDPRATAFLSLREVAEDLGESLATVRAWAADGRLGPLYGLPNGKKKIRVSDYELWLNERMVERQPL